MDKRHEQAALTDEKTLSINTRKYSVLFGIKDA